jgi:hypothetical protein
MHRERLPKHVANGLSSDWGREFPSQGSQLSRAEMPLIFQQPPNPSIEGMPKRLRLLCTPHVKR